MIPDICKWYNTKVKAKSILKEESENRFAPLIMMTIANTNAFANSWFNKLTLRRELLSIQYSALLFVTLRYKN